MSKLPAYLKTILGDPERKGLLRMAREFSILSVRGRAPAKHYFSSLLYKSGIDNPADYLTAHEIHHPQEALCERGTIDIAANKLLFQEFFEKRQLPLPRLLAYNFGRKLYFVRGESPLDVRKLESVEALREATDLLFAASATDSIFMKLINGSLGIGARKISRKAGLSDVDLSQMLDQLSSQDLLFQQEILQHSDLCRLNPGCVNTIRIDTLKLRNGEPEILSALIRIGLGKSVVDNIAAGGIFVGIDLDSGCLKERGFRNLQTGGKFYRSHPDTKTTFKGFKIPFLSEVKRLAMRAADLLPAGLLGWDFAVSTDGPVLIEGNAVYYSMELSDIAYGGYKTNPIFKKALRLAMQRH